MNDDERLMRWAAQLVDGLDVDWESLLSAATELETAHRTPSNRWDGCSPERCTLCVATT